ncbi:hypothetical protein LO749_20855 [Paracoccus denitrificans]|uniref:hypothetical protein n=1 Tax=Paracoccus denitrificans TaxID=266 RepID=UPI001E3BFF57|nr:hypothetical protein [Paracoccus denitrificans]UFS66945.1 hypothetical protein LO749_20855 [Paracoccus denitrificans]
MMETQNTPSPAAKPAPKSSRKTSKKVLVLNTVMGWGLAFFGVYMGNEMVTTGALAFIAALYGTYTGVGHLDFRTAKAGE